MARAKIQDIRRRELIEATIQSISKSGFADLTVGHISRQAGASAGNIHYYFGGKNELLEATMRWLLTTLRKAGIARLTRTKTPRERLEAVVQANFDPLLFTPENVCAWIQFWAQAPYDKRLKRLQDINTARVRSNLLEALRPLVPGGNALAASDMIQMQLDGIWLRAAQTAGGMPVETGANLAQEAVEAALRTYGSKTPEESSC
jgi:TetR/AcrR family transcriptional repressor of bet genes